MAINVVLSLINDSYYQLDEEGKRRYKKKLGMIGLKDDPYFLPLDHWLPSRALQLKVESPDICVCITNSPSSYTMEKLKCYKSSEVWAYFVAGFVEDTLVAKVNEEVLHMTAKIDLISYSYSNAIQDSAI